MISLSELLTDHQEFHSDLQMNSFITLRSGGTMYGCYKQALRELSTRKMALIQRYAHRARLALEIDALQAEASPEPAPAGTPESSLPLRDRQQRLNAIDLSEKRLMIEECRRVIVDTEREFMCFYQQAAALREALRSEGIGFPLDAATRNRLDSQMWEHQLKCMAAVDFMTCGRLAAQTVGLLQSCPVEMRRRIARVALHAEGQPALIDWYLNYELPIPAPVRIETGDVRKLIECSGS